MEEYLYPERPEGYSEWTEDVIYECFCKWMNKNYSIDINKDLKYREAIRDMIFGILSAKEAELTIIPASMGMGKSSLLMVFAKFMAINDPEFGCVIVKERIDDMDLLEQQLGYVDDEYCERKIGIAWKGFNVESCIKGYKKYKRGMCSECESSICEVKTAPQEQYKYPVLIITHERLFRLSNTEELLSSLRMWKDEYGNKHERRYIFIDEQPKFFETYKENWKNFGIFISELKRVSNSAGINIDTDKIETIGGHLFYSIKDKEARSSRDTYFGTKDEILSELRKVEKVWWKLSSESLSDLFPVFMNFFSNGGYRNGDELTTYQYTDYIFDEYKTIIMDGTAKYDLSYPSKKRVIDIPEFNTFENLVIHHYAGANLSKSKLKPKPEYYLSGLIQDISEVSSKGKTLVVVSKEFQGVLEDLLQSLPNIVIAHFNSLKGTNKYRDCTNIFFAGTMDFGDDYYILKAFALDKDNVTDFSIEAVNKVRIFENDFINKVKLSTNLCYLLQDIFRISIRNVNDAKQQQNNVFLFNTNEELIRLIIDRLPGSKYEQWKPLNVLESKAPRQSKLLEQVDCHLAKSGDMIDKKALRTAIGMSDDKEFQRLLRHEFIQQELAKREITGWEAGNRSRNLRKR